MNVFSDDPLAQFRTESDRAFFQMQQAADQRMAEFLATYGGDSAGAVAESPSIFSAQTTLKQRFSPDSNQANGNDVGGSGELFPGSSQAESLYSQAIGVDPAALNKSFLTDSVNDVQSDFQDLAEKLKEESRLAAREALKGTSSIIQDSASDLGQRAKEEAAALRQAMIDAMAEERSLRSLKGRAAEEARKAKERFKQQVTEAKAEAVDNLQDVAQGALDKLKGKAMGAFESGTDSLQREWSDFVSGKDTPQ